MPIAFVSNVSSRSTTRPQWLDKIASALPIKPLADQLHVAFDRARRARGSPAATCSCSRVWLVVGAFLRMRFMRTVTKLWPRDTGARRAHGPRRDRRSAPTGTHGGGGWAGAAVRDAVAADPDRRPGAVDPSPGHVALAAVGSVTFVGVLPRAGHALAVGGPRDAHHGRRRWRVVAPCSRSSERSTWGRCSSTRGGRRPPAAADRNCARSRQRRSLCDVTMSATETDAGTITRSPAYHAGGIGALLRGCAGAVIRANIELREPRAASWPAGGRRGAAALRPRPARPARPHACR